jgi:hypothetical protein
MTDDEAKKRIEVNIEGFIEARGAPWPTEEMRAQYERAAAADIAALRHALQAIEDRATLVKIADKGWPGFAELDAAHRHMRGEP